MKIFEKEELKTLWPFYLASFISASFFIYILFYVIFFQEFLSFFQISVLLAVEMIAAFLFEVPTGAVADVFGRKFSVIIGLFLEVLVFIFI